MDHREEKRKILAIEAVSGRQVALRRRFNATLMRKALGGGIKRPLQEDNAGKGYVKKKKVLGLMDFNVGIEIETCCGNVPSLEYFKQTGDASIRCADDEQEAVEFVLHFKDRKYFQNRAAIVKEMQTIFDACSMCAESNHHANFNHSSCGVHVHLSHPLVAKKDYPAFAKVFSQYWVSSLYNALKDPYRLRQDNSFCVENICYYGDKHEKYRQLNVLPSEDSDVWHFEFRGMGDIHGANVALVDDFIESLALGFTDAFRSRQNVVDYKEELYDLLIGNRPLEQKISEYLILDTPIAWVMALLNDARESGSPIRLDERFYDGADWDILNEILHHASYNENDVNDVKTILGHAKNLDPVWNDDYEAWFSPLYWIDQQDKRLAVALLPYFKERGYRIGDKEEFSREVLDAWRTLA